MKTPHLHSAKSGHLPAALLFCFAATSGPVNGASYDNWKGEYFNATQLSDSGISGPYADPDGDGKVNYVEFALSSHPLWKEPEALIRLEIQTNEYTAARSLLAKYTRGPVLYNPLVLAWVSNDAGVRWRTDRLEWLTDDFRADGTTEVTLKDKWPLNNVDKRFIRLQVAEDQDMDGLPDDWELSVGLDPTNPFDAMMDNDGDGYTNWNEFSSGTNMADAADNASKDVLPAMPEDVMVVTNPDGSKTVRWTDKAWNENEFIIYHINGNGTKVEIGRVNKNQTSFNLPPGL